MELDNTVWEALEAFMQRSEYLIDREYVSACRHYAREYDRDQAFDVWQSALNRYTPFMQEVSRMTGAAEGRMYRSAILTDECIRAGLMHMAQRIPAYAMLRTGHDQAVKPLLCWMTNLQEAGESCKAVGMKA